MKAGLPLVVAVTVLLGSAVARELVLKPQLSEPPLPTGKTIHPPEPETGVGSFPCNMIKTPDGKFLLVTDSGFRQQVSVLNAETGAILDKHEFTGRNAIYFGLAAKTTANGYQVAVSRGSQDMISLFDLSPDGKLGSEIEWKLPPAQNSLRLPWHVAGLAWSSDGSKLYAVANQSHKDNQFKGSLFTFDSRGGVLNRADVGSFPLDVAAIGTGQVFVANEGENTVSVLDADGKPLKTVRTGDGPSYLAASHNGDRVFVSNSNSDTVSVISMPSLSVSQTILVRPAEIRSLPSATPMGLSLNPNDDTLYVACGDLNATAVIDLGTFKLTGYIPAGWYPTSTQISNDNKTLFVANAKGDMARHPNGKPVGAWGDYGPNIIEGTVSAVSSKVSDDQTRQVLEDSQTSRHGAFEQAKFPPIKHFIYIVKENRTYDQILGDDPKGNGDSTLTMYGKDVTPNQHALADRFGLFDNFYVCAEVSADGWNWSTSGMANDYTERNTFYNYSGRGRGYDFEGTDNGTAVKLEGKRDVAEAAGGRIWDNFIDHGKTVRNYGMLVTPGKKDGETDEETNQPKLVGRTNPDFRQFDTAYPDSDAAEKLGVKPAPRQMLKFGTHGATNRTAVWLRDFKEEERTGDMPNLTLMRVMRDHTAGTANGQSSPRAMVADNDYAVGEIVDAVSHSRFWDSTAIFVVEDDAQDGDDHVDSHRSNMLVVSPYLANGGVYSHFYNTDSILATMEAIAGLKPNNDYVAIAPLFNLFQETPVNVAPFDAILPDKAIIGEVNTRESYRSKDSDRLFSRFDEDSEADMELNEILWRDAKGPKAPLPKTPGVMWGR